MTWNPVVQKDQGGGMKVDVSTPTFPWHDLIGDVVPKTVPGAGTPTFAAYQGNIYGYWFALNDVIDCIFHMPHDLAMSGTTPTDIYLHIHWSHTDSVSVTGNAVFTYYSTYAKGHNQANFPAEVTGTITYATTNLTTTPQYRHRIDEIQLSVAGGSASQLNSTNFEPDGLIFVRVKLTTLPTFGGTGHLFIHTIDLHYQSAGIGTKNKAPNFYA